MDLKQLTALVTVAEAGSVTKAARLLHLVQPAVTRQIRTLEDELGVSLFVRTPQGMEPTAVGTAVVERARRALLELERARAEIRSDTGQITGIATVGLLESSVELLARPLAECVLERYPGIKLRLVTAYSGHLQRFLDDGDVDVSLLYNLRDTQSLQVRPLLRECLHAVAADSSGWPTPGAVHLRDLVDRPMIKPSHGHGLRVLIDEALARAGVVAQVALETSSMQLQKKMVTAGIGWTILPVSATIGEVSDEYLATAELADRAAARDVVIGLARGRRPTPAVAVVADQMYNIARNLVSSGTWPADLLSQP